jgi:hypothetical protein
MLGFVIRPGACDMHSTGYCAARRLTAAVIVWQLVGAWAVLGVFSTVWRDACNKESVFVSSSAK